uniref:Uncharacterized protein n=1 Tax=Anopheles funestus TaxID=62324 RepID=A0A182S2E9_ANOFN
MSITFFVRQGKRGRIKMAREQEKPGQQIMLMGFKMNITVVTINVY